ncbi:MAG: hypothetical protein IPI54_03835 [Chitinophagaceae bacterium]|nr:hypothetical protein [Chitinophagaceae bacterium]
MTKRIMRKQLMWRKCFMLLHTVSPQALCGKEIIRRPQLGDSANYSLGYDAN